MLLCGSVPEASLALLRSHPSTSRPNPKPAVTTKHVHKGKTLAEIEDEEGGPVKESLVGMAHVKRAQRRRAGRAVDETELPADIAAAEERYEGEEEEGDDDDGDEGMDVDGGSRKHKGGRAAKAGKAAAPKKGGGPTAVEVAPLPGDDAAPMTAFNLNEEREEGHFDEDGNFVFDKGDPNERDDEWLRSEEGGRICLGLGGKRGGVPGPPGVEALPCCVAEAAVD